MMDLYSMSESSENNHGGSQYGGTGMSNFANMLMPYDSSYVARLANKKANPNLGQENMVLLRNVFETLLSSRNVIYNAKIIFKDKNIDFHRIFESVDTLRKGFLLKEDFYKYLVEGIPEFREGEFQELTIFMQKCDLDNDGKVTFKDFYMFFSL